VAQRLDFTIDCRSTFNNIQYQGATIARRRSYPTRQRKKAFLCTGILVVAKIFNFQPARSKGFQIEHQYFGFSAPLIRSFLQSKSKPLQNHDSISKLEKLLPSPLKTEDSLTVEQVIYGSHKLFQPVQSRHRIVVSCRSSPTFRSFAAIFDNALSLPRFAPKFKL
jgi:hypothetical protein